MSVDRQHIGDLPPRGLRAEAAAWIAKLHGPERSAELEEDFQSWLKADPENARAFEQVTDVWESIASVNVGGLPRLAGRDAFDERSGRARTKDERSRPARTKWAIAACAVVAAGIGSFALLHGERYSTDIGEQRTVSLADGSRIFLNSSTRVDVEYGKSRRLIELESGEAYFEVAKEGARPFVVRAGERQITALGTAFVVRRDLHQVVVTLVEGKVTVAPFARAQPSSTEAMLAPGQRLTVADGSPAKIDVPRPETTAAWRRGEVILDEMLLKDAAREMNRYDRTRLLIEDEGIGDLTVSGIYRSGNNRDFAKAVAAMYPVEVREESGEIRLSRKADR